MANSFVRYCCGYWCSSWFGWFVNYSVVNKKSIPQTLYRVRLSFVHAKELYTAFEMELGLFDRMSTAEHIRRTIAASNPHYKVLLVCTEVPNPRLTYDLSISNDYRIF